MRSAATVPCAFQLIPPRVHFRGGASAPSYVLDVGNLPFLLMSRPSTNASRPGSTSSHNSLQSTGMILVRSAANIAELIVFPGKLSDSTAKLLQDMAKKSGLALKQINEVSDCCACILSQPNFSVLP